MARQGNAAPVIIKRKKIIAGGGHHGGAWKVAYADFVTAMMAFFLLMWLLNATTEKQRKGLADYFNPTIAINRISGGGDGAFGGDSMLSEATMAQSGTGASADTPTANQAAIGVDGDADGKAEQQILEEMAAELLARSGESMTMERLMRHVVTKVTDEGLVVELFDLPDQPLFDSEAGAPRPILRDLAQIVAEVFALAQNRVAVQVHVRSYPITLIENPVWELSARRAQVARGLLEEGGLDPARMQRVTGFADRKPAATDPMLDRNNRVEMVLLRRNR